MRRIEIVFKAPKDKQEIVYFKGCGIGNMLAITFRLNDITDALTKQSKRDGENFIFSWHFKETNKTAKPKPRK